MIRTRIELLGLDETVVRPVMTIVVKDILKMFKINHDVYIRFYENEPVRQQTGNGTVTGSNTVMSEWVQLTTDENSDDNTELSLFTLRPDQKEIYKDEDITASIVPVYHNRKVSANIKYYNQSKSKIDSIVNLIRMAISTDDIYWTHQLEYSYAIPNFVLALVLHICKLKNDRYVKDSSKTPIPHDKYIETHFDDRGRYMYSPDNVSQKANLGIQEAQLSVQGYMTGEIHNIKAEYDNEKSAWFISLDYEFMYEKPVSLVLDYPIIVFNQQIDKMFYTHLAQKTTQPTAFRSYGTKHLARFANPRSTVTNLNRDYFLRIPSFDNTKLPTPAAFTARMFSTLVMLDDEDLKTLISLSEIPTVSFKKSIYNFIVNSEKDNIFTLHESLIYAEVYKNGKRDTSISLHLNSDGIITADEPFDIYGLYHVSFSVITDMDILSVAARERLKEYIASEKDLMGLEDAISEYQDISNTLTVSYLTLLNIPASAIEAAVDNSHRTQDILFNVKYYHWRSYFTKEISMILTGFLNQKGK